MSKLRNTGTKQDRYAYKRMKMGIKFHELQGKTFRFITLTGACNESGHRKNFDSLRRWIRKNYGSFEYFAIRTKEGTNGVFHILFVGKSIRWGDLSSFWKDKTGYWNVHISKVKDFVSIGYELTRQQKTVRYSQSKGWYPWKKLQEKTLCGKENHVLIV